MRYLTAYEIVLEAQLSGHTDRTILKRGENNFYKMLAFAAYGFEFSASRQTVNGISESLVLISSIPLTRIENEKRRIKR